MVKVSFNQDRPDYSTEAPLLKSLLAPVLPQTFLDTYWQRKPLYVQGFADKFKKLFSHEMFDRAVANHSAAGTDPTGVSAYVGRNPAVYVSGRQVREMVESGATIYFHDISQWSPELASVAAIVKSEINFTGAVGVHSFLSAEGAGFPVHYDGRMGTTMQIAGCKRWRFSRSPATYLPRFNVIPRPNGFLHVNEDVPSPQQWEFPEPPDESSFEEVILRPGDLLCLPAGTWHAAEAIGESLSVNLYFQTVDALELIRSNIQERLIGQASWRESIVPMIGRSDSGRSMPALVRQSLISRIEDLKRALTQLAEDDRALEHVWNRAIVFSSAPSIGNVPPPHGTLFAPVERNDLLCLSDTAPIRHGLSCGDNGETVIAIYRGNVMLSFPESAQSLVENLMKGHVFSAEATMQWADPGYSWEEVSSVIQVLLDGEILVRVDKPVAEGVAPSRLALAS